MKDYDNTFKSMTLTSLAVHSKYIGHLRQTAVNATIPVESQVFTPINETCLVRESNHRPAACQTDVLTTTLRIHKLKNDIKSILRDESKNKSRKQYEA